MTVFSGVRYVELYGRDIIMTVFSGVRYVELYGRDI